MKICVTSQDENLDSQIDLRFGRAEYFIIIDLENSKTEAVKNEHASEMGGVGVRSAQLMADKGVSCVITGRVGPNAFKALQSLKIEIFTGASGTVKETVEKYKKGELKKAESADAVEKSGLKKGGGDGCKG